MIGSRVMGLWSNGSWYPGTVTERRDRGGQQEFFVQFDDGDTAWLRLDQLRQQPGAHAAVPGHNPFPGARVMADWTEDSWYPGYVAEANAHESLFFVQFDDGDTKWLPAVKIRPHGDRPNAAPAPHLTAGTVVHGEWSSDSWYPGVVARVNANSTLFFIQFDDGDQKWLPVHLLRFGHVAAARPASPSYPQHPPPSAPHAPAAYAPAVLAVEKVIERQVLVVRCAYCKKLTPADLTSCEQCGARQ